MLAAIPVNTVNAVRQGGIRMATMERWTQVFTSDKAWTIQIENEQERVIQVNS